MFILIPALGLQ